MIITVTLNPALDRTLVVPELIYDEVIHSRPPSLDWGGKGFNVSRALKVLGSSSLAMGFVGGFPGAQIEAGLHALGIETDFIHIQGDTRTNTMVIEEKTNRHIKINEPGPTIQESELGAFQKRLDHHLHRSTNSGSPATPPANGSLPLGENWGEGIFPPAPVSPPYTQTPPAPPNTWVLSGSLPPGAPNDLYGRLIEKIQSNGSHAYLDASGEALRLGLEAKPYFIKPNRKEAEEIVGFSLAQGPDLSRAGDFFLKKGVSITAISLGPEGLYLYWNGGFAWAHTSRLTVQNPTGAGDALLAGFLWALERGEGLREAARWGAACGAAAAQGEGVGLPSMAVVESFFYKGTLG